MATANRGLCGGFNSSITRATRARLRELGEQGKTTKIICVGRKGREQLRREFGGKIIDHTDGIGRSGGPSFEEADQIGRGLTKRFEEGEFDTCTVVYNRFKTVMSQVVTFQQADPLQPAHCGGD